MWTKVRVAAPPVLTAPPEKFAPPMLVQFVSPFGNASVYPPHGANVGPPELELAVVVVPLVLLAASLLEASVVLVERELVDVTTVDDVVAPVEPLTAVVWDTAPPAPPAPGVATSGVHAVARTRSGAAASLRIPESVADCDAPRSSGRLSTLRKARMSGFYAVLFATLALDAVLLGGLVWAFYSPRFADHRIQPGQAIKVPLAKRVRSAVVSSGISLAAIVGSTWFLHDALFYDRPTSFVVKVLQGGGILLVYDFAYYGLHRAMHIKKVMRFVHGVHHRATNPSALESFYLHPVELLAGLGLLLASTRLVGPVHEHAFIGAFFVYSTLNIVIHSGLDFRHPLLAPIDFLTKKHHVHHFDDFAKNYSSLTPLPDLLFGTSGFAGTSR
jgi:sterol desaturase/sphingolipid hydroxylase (fatty acid hydroxylase superfamily)